MLTTLMLSLVLPLQIQDSPEPLRLVRVDLDASGVNVHDLNVLDLDLAAHHHEENVHSVDVVADTADLALMRREGLALMVLIDDLVAYYAARLEGPPETVGSGFGQWLSPPFGQGGMGGYYPFDEVEAVLDQISAQYPSIVTQKVRRGRSYPSRNFCSSFN